MEPFTTLHVDLQGHHRTLVLILTLTLAMIFSLILILTLTLAMIFSLILPLALTLAMIF